MTNKIGTLLARDVMTNKIGTLLAIAENENEYHYQ